MERQGEMYTTYHTDTEDRELRDITNAMMLVCFGARDTGRRVIQIIVGTRLLQLMEDQCLFEATSDGQRSMRIAGNSWYDIPVVLDASRVDRCSMEVV